MWRMLEEEPCLPGRTHGGAVSEDMCLCALFQCRKGREEGHFIQLVLYFGHALWRAGS